MVFKRIAVQAMLSLVSVNLCGTVRSNVVRFTVSLDASKAFDSGLFVKLAKRRIPLPFIRMLKYWYSHLQCAVLWKGVLGNIFNITRGVRQGGVLSPFLFSIRKLRSSGYGLYIGNVFTGCIMYADDIMLLACSCFGLQRLVDTCEQYGKQWDIIFNPRKTQCVTFGGKNPDECCIILNGNKLEWIEKLTYLGCHFLAIHVKLILVPIFGNIMEVSTILLSVLGKNRNEISCVHLVKTYCVPSLLCGCEVWNLSCAEYRHLNVVWNNTFRKKFNCCWRESTRQLLFYCEVLPMAYLVDQQTICFTKGCKVVKILC